MKILYYIITAFMWAFTISVGAETRVMLAEGEIIVLDTSTVEMVPTISLTGSVSRSVFTTKITAHEPMDEVKNLQFNNRRVIYFSELRNMSGQTAIHRWEFNGNVMAETKFKIGGPRWRVWSSKNLVPSWVGEWKVSVLNDLGDIISEDVFKYSAE